MRVEWPLIWFGSKSALTAIDLNTRLIWPRSIAGLSLRQSLSAAIEEINRPRGLAAAVVQLSRDIHNEVTRDNAFCCEGRAPQKTSPNNFLQNEANIAARREMHDKASYQFLKSSKMAVLNFYSGLILAVFCVAEKIARY